MKKIVVILFTLLWLIPAAQAVPALRGKFQYKQPDGTVIMLELHGDEHYHWTTDASGRTVDLGEDGFYHPVDAAVAARRARAAQVRAQARSARWSSFSEPFPTNFGDRKILCLLAEFQPEKDAEENVLFDGKYVLDDPAQHFRDMLNKANYNEDGAIGSVRDYFVENSMNQYRPEFDVFGPVTLSHSSSYYDDKGVHLAIIEAYGQLSGEIDINDYDTDNDGMVDMVLFYYPGHNEAEHAPSWTIWPHQGTTSGSFGNLGGKGFNRYFCTSELRGDSGENPAAIGTTCHEFSHSLGLPDFYDVGDGTFGGKNDIFYLTYQYDLMCYGNYNNEGRCPPYLTSLERNMLGWMAMPSPITSSGNQTLAGIKNNVALRINGKVDGEYFLLECRSQAEWDSGIPQGGMVVFQVDQSNRVIVNGVTAASLWNTNNINSYYDSNGVGHPCYRIVHSQESNYVNDLVFPGRGITSYSPVDWDGTSTGVSLSGISYGNGQVSFNVTVDGSKQIFGYVTDGEGNPLAGVTVTLSQSAYEFAAPPLIPMDDSYVTGPDGYYFFELEETTAPNQVVSAWKEGYLSKAYNVTASEHFTQQDFTLLPVGVDPPATLRRYDPSLGMTWGSNMNRSSVAVGMRYTAAELSAMNAVGSQLSKITFLGDAENDEGVYLVVDFDNQIILRQDVTSQYRAGEYVTVDISDKGIMIPQGKDVYIGYGFTNIQTSYPFPIYGPMSAANNGAYFWSGDFLTSTQRGTVTFSGRIYDFVISAILAREAEIDFASYDVSYAKLVDGVPQVVPAAGKTVHAVTWYVDGTAVGSNPPAVETLSTGAHTFMARLEYYDGTAERVYYDVTKE